MRILRLVICALLFCSHLCYGQIKQLAELTASDGTPGDYFGYQVAISGNVIVAGSNDDATDEGAAYVYVKPAAGWSTTTQTAKLTAPNPRPSDAFGSSVAVSGDTVVVGSPNHPTNGFPEGGVAYVFQKQGGTVGNRMVLVAELTATDSGDLSFFGKSVAIDGDTVVVGAIGQQNNNGAVYIFVKPSSGWANMTQTAELTSASENVYGELGQSVSILGDTVVATAFNDNNLPGVAYIFVEPDGGWQDMTQTAELSASNGQANDGFGAGYSPLAIGPGVIVVGAYALDEKGGTYVFVEPETGWMDMTETAVLTASNSGVGDGFGGATAINGSVILVGAPNAAFNGNANQGAAYAYVKPASGWCSTQNFNGEYSSSDGAAGDHFGICVKVAGSTAVIAAPYTDGGIGKAYVFGR